MPSAPDPAAEARAAFATLAVTQIINQSSGTITAVTLHASEHLDNHDGLIILAGPQVLGKQVMLTSGDDLGIPSRMIIYPLVDQRFLWHPVF